MFLRQVLFYICRRFNLIFLNGRLSGASFQHNSSNDLYTVVPRTQTVLRSMAIPGNRSCASLLSARRSAWTVVAGDFQLLLDNACSLS